MSGPQQMKLWVQVQMEFLHMRTSKDMMIVDFMIVDLMEHLQLHQLLHQYYRYIFKQIQQHHQEK